MGRFDAEIGRISIEAGVYQGEGWISVGMDADCSGAISITADEALRLSKAFERAAFVSVGSQSHVEP